MATPPVFRAATFTCPHCGAFAQMGWGALWVDQTTHTEYQMSACVACKGTAVWKQLFAQTPAGARGLNIADMIYPAKQDAPMPHADLPGSCLVDYQEARSIANSSPRGAAALLRLCIQKICVELGEKGKNINDDIGSLVRKGLPVQVKEALDVVRVTGNEAVHPGTISLADHAAQVNMLFTLVNLIVDILIAQPARIAAMHAALPAGQLAGIAQRDAPKKAVPPT